MSFFNQWGGDSDSTKTSYNQNVISSERSISRDNDDTLLQVIKDLSQQIHDCCKNQKEIIQKQHNIIEQYKSDVYLKIKKDLLMELIGIADQIKNTIDEQQKKKDYDKLLEDIVGLQRWVDCCLRNESVKQFSIAKEENSKFDGKYQELSVMQTDNKNEDGTLKSILPGYFWTMPLVDSAVAHGTQSIPKSFEFVLRPEQVCKLQFQNKCEASTDLSSINAHEVNIPKLDQ